MAARRKRSSTRRRRRNPAPVARANPRRRRRSIAAAPRRRRRRRNPSFNIMGGLIGAVGGAALGLGAYALGGQDLSMPVKAAIAGIGGLAIGIGVTSLNGSAGAGLAGGGAAIAAMQLAETYLDKSEGTTAGVGRIPGYARRKYGEVPNGRNYYHLPRPMHAHARMQMNAVQADLGAVQAPIGTALRADLTGLA